MGDILKGGYFQSTSALGVTVQNVFSPEKNKHVQKNNNNGSLITLTDYSAVVLQLEKKRNPIVLRVAKLLKRPLVGSVHTILCHKTFSFLQNCHQMYCFIDGKKRSFFLLFN